MDHQPFEDFPLSSAGRREKNIALPSEERLENLMKGPRKQARYFNDTIAEQYPTRSGDETLSVASIQTPKIISGELDKYEAQWLRHLPGTEKKFQSLASSSSDVVLQKRELLFHKINQFIMPQWHDVLGIPKPKKKNSGTGLYSAQIGLAIESTLLLSAVDNFEHINQLDSELNDVDAMILLLQRSIDGEPINEPQVYLPHPKMGRKNHQTTFIKFEPTDENSFIKTEVTLQEVLEPEHVPGLVAIHLLSNLRINEVSRRPEFQDRAAFSKFALAHRNAKLYLHGMQQTTAVPQEDGL